jgi:MinD-like ATPase involved in chromosome partitioning or flagellar assembly
MLHKSPSKKVGAVKHKVTKKKKISEQSILNKIHKVKKDVDKLDEAQHKHMTIGSIKMAGLTHLKHKYGLLSAKKLMEKTKRGKAKIAKELRHVAASIKKIHSI